MSTARPKVRLGEVIQHRKEFITIDDIATYKRPRVQLHAQGIVLRDEVPGALIKTKKQQVCHAGEFLVAEIDAKVGGFGIVPESLEGSLVSIDAFLITSFVRHRSASKSKRKVRRTTLLFALRMFWAMKFPCRRWPSSGASSRGSRNSPPKFTRLVLSGDMR
jgi:hypothetical protein